MVETFADHMRFFAFRAAVQPNKLFSCSRDSFLSSSHDSTACSLRRSVLTVHCLFHRPLGPRLLRCPNLSPPRHPPLHNRYPHCPRLLTSFLDRWLINFLPDRLLSRFWDRRRLCFLLPHPRVLSHPPRSCGLDPGQPFQHDKQATF